MSETTALPCRECEGEGEVEYRACSHGDFSNCPCPGRMGCCEECGGSGVEECRRCDAEAVCEVGGSPLCAECAEVER